MTTMNQAATGAGSTFALVQETVYGTTPAAPSLQQIRTRPPQLNPEAENFLRDQEIGNGRMPTAHRRIFEGGQITLPTPFIFGNADELLAGILGGAWTADQLVMGNAPRSYTSEIHRADATTPYFVRGVGTFLNAFELQIGADGNEPSLLTLNGLVKEITGEAATADAGGGYTPPVAFDEFINENWDIQVDAAPFELISLTMNYQDARDPKRIVGQRTAAGMNRAAGGVKLNGTIVGFAESKAHIDRWKNQTESALTAVGTDSAGNVLTISVPKWKAGNVSEAGDAGVIRFEMPWEAYDPTGTTLLTLTRASA